MQVIFAMKKNALSNNHNFYTAITAFPRIGIIIVNQTFCNIVWMSLNFGEELLKIQIKYLENIQMRTTSKKHTW